MQDSTGRSETRNTTKGVLVTQLYVGMNTSFDTWMDVDNYRISCVPREGTGYVPTRLGR